MPAPRTRLRPRWRAAFRLVFQYVALVLAVFVAQQPGALPVPPPDVDHVEPVAHGQPSPNATRLRAPSRSTQSSVLKRLPALPSFVLDAHLMHGQMLARTEAPEVKRDCISPGRIQRRIPRMDSDEPPRG
jgi:hypothetical protein